MVSEQATPQYIGIIGNISLHGLKCMVSQQATPYGKGCNIHKGLTASSMGHFCNEDSFSILQGLTEIAKLVHIIPFIIPTWKWWILWPSPNLFTHLSHAKLVKLLSNKWNFWRGAGYHCYHCGRTLLLFEIEKCTKCTKFNTLMDCVVMHFPHVPQLDWQHRIVHRHGQI